MCAVLIQLTLAHYYISYTCLSEVLSGTDLVQTDGVGDGSWGTGTRMHAWHDLLTLPLWSPSHQCTPFAFLTWLSGPACWWLPFGARERTASVTWTYMWQEPLTAYYIAIRQLVVGNMRIGFGFIRPVTRKECTETTSVCRIGSVCSDRIGSDRTQRHTNEPTISSCHHFAKYQRHSSCVESLGDGW